jgi:hypothetical protein
VALKFPCAAAQKPDELDEEVDVDELEEVLAPSGRF